MAVELLHGREIRPVTARSWRRSHGWADDGLWHFYLPGRFGRFKAACRPRVLEAGAVANEGDPLCPQCVAVAHGHDGGKSHA